MNDGLHLSGQGAGLVKSFEGCLRPIDAAKTQFKPYICPAGVLTIGWGHTNDNGRKFTPRDIWTQGECDAEFRADMQKFEAAVRRRVKVELTQQQFDALTSFTYNCGEGNLQKSSLLRKVNAKDFEGAAGEFVKWNRGGGKVLAGLTRRRAAEAKLFGSGHPIHHVDPVYQVPADPSDEEPMAQSVDAPPADPSDTPPKTMATSKIGNAQIGIGAAGAMETASAVNDAATQAGALKQNAHDLGIMDILSTLVTQPMFWAGVAIIAGAAFTWYWRRQHRQAGV